MHCVGTWRGWIGKTALVREFTHESRSGGFYGAACDDLFTPRALAPLHDIASQTKGTLLEPSTPVPIETSYSTLYSMTWNTVPRQPSYLRTCNGLTKRPSTS